MATAASTKPAEWRRWLGILLRSGHIAAITLLGADLLGAGGIAAHGAVLTLVTGAALFASELADRRVRVDELAGALVIAKLVVLAWAIWLAPQARVPVFWALLFVSAVVAHAPKPLRHWPRR
jgi:hypothetical protein